MYIWCVEKNNLHNFKTRDPPRDKMNERAYRESIVRKHDEAINFARLARKTREPFCSRSGQPVGSPMLVIPVHVYNGHFRNIGCVAIDTNDTIEATI